MSRTVVLVDGENIDATLGTGILNDRPRPDQRPRWERLTDHLGREWGQPALGLFFLHARHGNMPTAFVGALRAIGYRPVPLTGRDDQKVVDLGILRTLEALAAREDDVVLVSHDKDFAEALGVLVADGRKVAVAGFSEFVSQELTALGVPFIDLEDDVKAFNVGLPRLRPIDVDEFDPAPFLD